MSKLLTKLMEAERKRRDKQGTADDNVPAPETKNARVAAASVRSRAPGRVGGNSTARRSEQAAADADLTALPEQRAGRESEHARIVAARDGAELGSPVRLPAEAEPGASRKAVPASRSGSTGGAIPKSGLGGWPQRVVGSVLALTLMIGVGIGFWLGRTSDESLRAVAPEPDSLRLRLDYRIGNPQLTETRVIPRDLPRSQ